MAERSKARVCGRLLAGIAGSNPAGSMDVCVVLNSEEKETCKENYKVREQEKDYRKNTAEAWMLVCCCFLCYVSRLKSGNACCHSVIWCIIFCLPVCYPKM